LSAAARESNVAADGATRKHVLLIQDDFQEAQLRLADSANGAVFVSMTKRYDDTGNPPSTSEATAMPVHDWGKVDAGIFHDFHNAWITELRNALNAGVLPPSYYALGQQFAGNTGPDVLTLQTENRSDDSDLDSGSGGLATVTAKPPKVRIVQTLQNEFYILKRRTLVIRHVSDDRVVAMLEIMSVGNKASSAGFRRFVDKAINVMNQGIHLTIVDLFPPSKRDPQGIHGAIWSECADDSFHLPSDKPLTLVAYSVIPAKTAYVEPVAVGDTLPDMPLFLEAESYVEIPLEATYQRAYVGVPRRWREVLESPANHAK
jgi:hypothetical protein